MTHAIARRTLTLAAIGALLGATPASKPASRPSPASKPAPRASDVIHSAVVALAKEGVDAARANKPFPRDSPDYFAGDVTLPQSDLLAALARPQHPNPRIDAYVKLQLLSAVGTFDAANATAAINAYVLGAPAIVPMPMLDPHARGDWDGKQSEANDPDFVARTNDAYAQQIDAGERADEIVIAYRDAMRTRIGVDAANRVRLFNAELEDYSQRAAGGLNVTKPVGKLATELKKWSATATRAQLAAMLKIVDEYAARHTSAIVYTKLTWNVKTRHARWDSRPAAIEATKLTAMKADLLAAQHDAAN